MVSPVLTLKSLKRGDAGSVGIAPKREKAIQDPRPGQSETAGQLPPTQSPKLFTLGQAAGFVAQTPFTV